MGQSGPRQPDAGKFTFANRVAAVDEDAAAEDDGASEVRQRACSGLRMTDPSGNGVELISYESG